MVQPSTPTVFPESEQTARRDAELLHQVAELTRLQAALRRRERQLSLITENVPALISYVDADQRYRFVNKRYEDWFGAPRQQLIGRHVREVIGEQTYAEVRPGIEAALSGKEAQLEATVPGHDGVARRAFACFVPDIDDESGAAKGYFALVTDITERLRAEEQLKRSEEHCRMMVRAILETAVDGIITIDEHGVVESLNPAAQDMFGYGAEEVVGNNVAMLMPEPHRSAHDQYLRRFLARGATGGTGGTGGTGATGAIGPNGFRREVRGRRKDGTVFPMDISVSEVPLDDRRLYTGIVRDVSERKVTEAALRRQRDFAESLIDTAQAIVLVLDPEGCIVRFNQYMEQVSGYRLADVRGRDWFELFIPTRDRRARREAFERALSGLRAHGSIDALVTRTGEEREIEWHDTPLEDASGDVVGILSVGQDVTEHREMTAKLATAERLALVGELAAGVAHEINNPLNVIINCAQLIADGDRDATLTGDILAESERIATIVRGLLDFARDGRSAFGPTNVAEVVDSTMALVRRRIERPGIDVRAHIEPDLPRVGGRRQQLQQVLLNLLLNSRDALLAHDAPGAKVIEVNARAITGSDHSRFVQIAVRDNGPGIEPHVLPKVFDPFFTTKRTSGGTGLGLSVSHGIVESHGGSIRAASVPGQFTEMTVELPALDEDP